MRATTLLLGAQAVITGLTGIVLFAWPETIPGSFGLSLTADAHLLCYFYGATELALSVASLAAAAAGGAVRRAAILSFAIMHLTEAAAGLLAVAQGLPKPVLANVAAHGVIAVLFILSLRPASAHPTPQRSAA